MSSLTIEKQYLIDTVALSKLKRQQLESQFVHDNAKVPEEIVYEARYFDHVLIIQSLMIPLSIELLEMIKYVLAQLAPDDKILDLFNNEGNGDIVILATALLAKQANEGQLFTTDYIIVTDDAGLLAKAKQFKIGTLSTKGFCEVIDRGGSKQGQ